MLCVPGNNHCFTSGIVLPAVKFTIDCNSLTFLIYHSNHSLCTVTDHKFTKTRSLSNFVIFPLTEALTNRVISMF